MVDLLYASGSFEFEDGVLATQYVGYVLGRPGEQGWDFQGGSAAIYGLHHQYFFARGYAALNNGSAFLSSEPLGAFEDFAMYPEAQPDPLNGFVLADNSGTLTGLGTTWSRHYRVVVPPKQARFAVPHIRFGSVPAGVSQYLDAHQFEVVPVGKTQPSPFSHARTVRVFVRPARLNYYAGSNHVTDLIPGRTYIASALVSGKRTSYILTAGAGGTIDLPFGDSVIDNGDGTSTVSTIIDNGDGTSTVASGLDNGDGTSTVGIVATKVLVEEGTTLRDYFDGNSGPDYLWEAGGTGTSRRSYYYPDRQMRHYVLVRNLQKNVALGMTVEDPVYATLPAASSTLADYRPALPSAPAPDPGPKPVPLGVSGAWDLVFRDEFNGTTLDTTRWIAESNRSMNNVLTNPANVTVSGGNLVLQLSADGVYGADVSSDPLDGAGANGYTFEVGDYLEAKVYAPGSTTTSEQFYNWPAFWATGRNWPTNGENDIWEGLGGDPTINYHYGSSPAAEQVNNSAPRLGTWGNGWHTYGAYRRPNKVEVYWDGVLNRTYNTNDLGGGQAVMVNIGKSGSRTLVPGAAGAIKVDYVRAWRAPVTDPVLPNWPLTFTAATASDTTATASWAAATNTVNGTPITGYRVYDTSEGLVGTFGNVTSATITGLTPGTPYILGVKAVNSAGESIQTSKTATLQTTFTVFPLDPASIIQRGTHIPTVETASATSIVLNKPTGTTTGDLLVATFAGEPTTAPTISGTGWTLRTFVNQSVALYTWTKLATSSEPATYTITSDATGRMSGIITRYTGVNQYSPIDVNPVNVSKTNGPAFGSTVTSNGLTTASNKTVLYGACAGGFSASNYLKDPVEMKRMFQTAGTGRRLSVADEYRAAAGATGTRSWTESSAGTNELDALLVAIRPGPARLGGLITRKQTATAETASATSITCNIPTGLANGDVMVMTTSFSGGTITTPTGWTLMKQQVAGSGAIVVAMFYRVVTTATSEPASYTVTGSAAASRISAQITAYSGVNNTTPMDVAAVGTSLAAGAGFTVAASITPVTAGAVLVGAAGTNSASAAAINPDPLMNEIWHSGGTGRQHTYDDEYRSSAGAVTRTWTVTGVTALESQVVLGALRPA